MHSSKLRVQDMTCGAGRTVALACAQFAYGHLGTCLSMGIGPIARRIQANATGFGPALRDSNRVTAFTRKHYPARTH